MGRGEKEEEEKEEKQEILIKEAPINSIGNPTTNPHLKMVPSATPASALPSGPASTSIPSSRSSASSEAPRLTPLK